MEEKEEEEEEDGDVACSNENRRRTVSINKEEEDKVCPVSWHLQSVCITASCVGSFICSISQVPIGTQSLGLGSINCTYQVQH